MIIIVVYNIRDVIQVYNQAKISDPMKNLKKEDEDIVRVGDDVLTLDHGEKKRYFNILFFVRIEREDKKLYDICVGNEFKAIQGPHVTGYQKLSKRGVFVCLLEKLQHRIHIVPDFGSKNNKSFLLNHDINRQCWSGADPVFFGLEDVVAWADESAEEDIDLDLDNTDEESIHTNNQESIEENEQREDRFAQFLGYT